MQDPQNNRTELLPLRTGAGRQENVSPSSRGRKMSLTSPLIDQAITPTSTWGNPEGNPARLMRVIAICDSNLNQRLQRKEHPFILREIYCYGDMP